MRFSIAMVCARSTFFAVIGKNAPAFTVASLATIMHRRPLTRPRPVTTPAPGAPPYSAYIPCAAHRPSSRNSVPSSSSRFSRSRTVRRPLACCASTAFSPPPRRIASSSARMATSNSSRAARFAFARAEAESSADRNRLSNFEPSGICTLTSTCRVPHLSGDSGSCDR